MTPDERDEWVARFLDEQGEEGDPAAFLAAHPDAPRALAATLQQLRQVAGRFPAPDRAPDSLGGWRLREEIGRGGVARVHRVDHPARPGVAGALKRLDPLLAGDARARQRFAREAELLQELAHPNLARVLDAGEEAGVPWLVLELCEGGSLAAWLDGVRARGDAPAACPLPGRAAGANAIATFVAAIADAVAALHARGIVHRDLKPANVLLARDGSPVVVDFGLAARVDRSTLSRTGDLLGTLPYMAPEQARGERAGPAADVWGLGALLHELLTLAPPRRGDDAVALLEEGRTRPIARLAASGSLPAPLAAIVERALAFRPSRRFGGAAALAEALRAFAAGKPIAIERPSALERTVDRLTARRRLVATLLATALLAGALAWSLGRRDRDGGGGDEAGATAAARADFARRWLAALGDEVALGATPRATLAKPPADLALHLDGLLADGDARRRANDSTGALAAFRAAVAARPDDPLAQSALAVAALQAGEPDAARRELAIAWRLLPATPPIARALAPLVEREGRRLFDAGDLAGAAEQFELLVALDPARDEAWRQLAVARVRLGDAAGARAAAERALSFPLPAAEREAALRTYALALEAEGMRAAAIDVLRGVVARAPDYLQARLSLGLLHDSDCDLSAAREQYAAALELAPDRSEPLIALIHLHSGSNRAQCERCRAAFAADPALEAPDQVEALAIRLLRSTGGATPALLEVVRRAKSMGRGAALRPVVDELIAAAPDDATLGALTRARRLLERE